jgi:hypothetical protein
MKWSVLMCRCPDLEFRHMDQTVQAREEEEVTRMGFGQARVE